MAALTVGCGKGTITFIETFAVKTWELEREGNIVLGCTLLPAWYCDVSSHFGERTGTKAQCDELHLRKIDLADEVLILNVGGYIGESTRNEIVHASKTGKPVRYLETLPTEDRKEISVKPICSNPEECCRALSRVWDALGITNYTGKSVDEHVKELKHAADQWATVQGMRDEIQTIGCIVRGDWWADCCCGDCVTRRKLLALIDAPPKE